MTWIARLLDRMVLWSLYKGVLMMRRYGAPGNPEFEARIVAEWRTRPRLWRHGR
jgi:hypothetical protein